MTATDEPRRCWLDETDSYSAARMGLNGELEIFTVTVLECSECGDICEQVEGDYERCPHCGTIAGEKPDSRERLEADMIKMCHMHGLRARPFLDLLDRQATITEREHVGLTISDDGSLINWRGENYLLQSKVTELEAERDELDEMRERYARALNQIADALGVEITDDVETHAREMVAIEELEAELTRKQRVIDKQRDSFLKLEAENAELRRADAPYQTGASREVDA